MDDKDRITALIWDAIDEVNELLPEEARAQKAEDAVLLGAWAVWIRSGS